MSQNVKPPLSIHFQCFHKRCNITDLKMKYNKTKLNDLEMECNTL